MSKAVTAIALLLTAQTSLLNAQPWMQNLPENHTFYDVQQAFNQYWEGKDHKQKGKGWKAFKRWEWFWEQRVYPTGEFPNPMQLYNEYGKVEIRKGNTPDRFSGNWTEMGPYDSPGGYAGIGRIACVRVDPVNHNVIWVGAPAGGLWKSTNAGLTWTTTTDELPSIGVTDVIIDPTNTNTMYIATGDGDAGDTYSIGVMKSTDGGTTWNTTGLNWAASQTRRISRLLMHPSDPNTLIAGGSGVHKSTDGGTSWVQVGSFTARDMEFKPGNPQIAYASTSGGQMYRSTNGGDTWTLLTNGTPGGGGRIALAVTPANPEYVYALASSGNNSGFFGFYRSTDSGTSWTLRANSPNLLGWEPDGSDIGGQGWYDLPVAASPSNANEVYTGGINNWKSTDGGATWQIITMWYNVGFVANIHADQHDLYFVPGTDILYAGNDGGIYRSTDHGVTWSWLGNGLKISQFYRFGLSATNPNVLIAGAQDNGTKAIVQAGYWDDVLGGDGMEALVDYSNANIMYGSLYYGDLNRSVNGGASFVSINNGITESGNWITPYIIHPTDPNTLFAGFQNLWKTTNRGTNWQRISTSGGTTFDVLVIAPSDPTRLYAVRGATVARSTDGGVTWISLPTPSGAGTITSIAIHPASPNQIWVTSSGYSQGNKVWKSLDAGQTWTNISGTLPNVPVNTIVFQNNSAERLYVGTDIGVYYRDLITSGWEDFNAGLANVVISELEVQYGAGKIRAATYGRGIWQSDLAPNQGTLIGPSPSELVFDRHEVGVDGDTVELTLGSFGSDTLVVASIAGNNTSFSTPDLPAFPLSLPPSSSYTLHVIFQPTAHGNVYDTLIISSNALNGPITRVPLSGKGIVIGRATPGALYGTSGLPSGQLFSVSTVTGTATPIGALGTTELSGLTVRPTTSELYGIFSNSAGSTLYRVSSGYGDALFARSIGVSNLHAIAFSTDDSLFGATTDGKLYRINVFTGDTVFIGQASGITYSGLSFNPVSGELWASVKPPRGSDKIYKVNTLTGQATLVGATGDGTSTPSLAFDALGKLYGLKGVSTLPNSLIAIDTITGTGTLIGQTGGSGLLAIAIRQDSILTSVSRSPESSIPDSYVLNQNYPNPFNPTTEISYGLPEQSRVTVTIYNVMGQEVIRLIDGNQSAGFHAVTWDATNSLGTPVASGVYLYKLEAASVETNRANTAFTDTKKMLLIR